MTILHIITRLILGGAQQNTVLSCAGQVQRGHRVILAYGPIYGPEGSLYDQARASGAELIEVKWMRRAVLPVHDWLCHRELRRLIRTVKPDVVHTHSSKAGIVGRAAAWKENVPAIVHTVHGLPFHQRNLRVVNLLYTALEREAAKHCHAIIGVTQAMCDEFLSRGIGRAGQYAVVPSGMDVAEFEKAGTPAMREEARRNLGIDEADPIVGIVARLDKNKGQEDLLDVMPGLLVKHPKMKLLLVGDGWRRGVIESRIKAEGLEGKVILTGLIPPERVPLAIAAMDVHALPSYQEGQPRTMVQALLASVPVVGYDAGGIKDVCVDGQTGILVPLGDCVKLAMALDRLLGDAELRKKLGAQGHDFAASRYDARRMVEMLESIYGRLVGRSVANNE